MLDHEYRKKREEQNVKRDWMVTVLFGCFALLSWSGIVAVWKYIGHDGYIIASVIIPLGVLSLILTFGALQGSRRTAKDVGEAIFNLFYFWA